MRTTLGTLLLTLLRTVHHHLLGERIGGDDAGTRCGIKQLAPTSRDRRRWRMRRIQHTGGFLSTTLLPTRLSGNQGRAKAVPRTCLGHAEALPSSCRRRWPCPRRSRSFTRIRELPEHAARPSRLRRRAWSDGRGECGAYSTPPASHLQPYCLFGYPGMRPNTPPHVTTL